MVVKIIPREPGESEFSHGKGIMPPEGRGYVPDAVDQLRAFHEVNKSPQNANATAVANYDSVTRETGPAGQKTNQAPAAQQ